MAATIGDVARRAGVSIATVSRVLSPGAAPHPVQAETARRVREAALALDFVPSAIARGLVSRQSGLIGLIVPDLADPHYPLIVRGAEDRARAGDLALAVCNTLADPRRLADYLRFLRGRGVDALILSGGSLSLDDLAAVHASGLPAVLIGRPLDGAPPFPYVAVDNLGTARLATQHLLETGRRRLAHLAGPPAQTTMLDRAAGFREAVTASPSTTGEVLITDGTPEDGVRVVLSVLQRPPAEQPDGLFAATDRLAAAALAAALDAGIRVPEELAVIGFDDLAIAPFLRPALSSVAQPAYELGARAVALALALSRGEQAVSEVLPARLVIRRSSGG